MVSHSSLENMILKMFEHLKKKENSIATYNGEPEKIINKWSHNPISKKKKPTKSTLKS